ncbi:MAG TPA: outer membrane protein assembly factor BamA [Gemmatimonadales bacterium]|nr:outer membrane protein assembly factor BamA [Gemmatimonadales bacterium]
MLRRCIPLLVLLVLAAHPLRGQDVSSPPVDSLVVEGNVRITTAQILGTAGLVLHQPVTYRDIQRAITAIFQTGQFDDVQVHQREANGLLILVIVVKERPLLSGWSLLGVRQLSEQSVRDKVTLVIGRPIDRAALARSRASIDSAYADKGYFQARTTVTEFAQPDGSVQVVFQVTEGMRITISQILIQGNERFSDKEVAGHMSTKPEGFWWFKKGTYDEDRVESDMRQQLPTFYGSKGMIDFQVVQDTVLADATTGKAALSLTVEEGQVYYVGSMDLIGNRRYSADEIGAYYPFGGAEAVRSGKPVASTPFNRTAWEAATTRLRDLYLNTGYIYSRVTPEESRRIAEDGTPTVDLRWRIEEGAPATVNRIMIVGNDVTHESVIRSAIVIFPGSVFNRDLLIRSYQNIMNLGFFQPLPPPDVAPSENGQDVDITFTVIEKRTGNVNFGASLGQGTGLGGFLGLEEPNLFGRGKRGKFQWQFGRNINDFNLSYTDPSIQGSRVSGTIALFNSRQRYIIGDLGRRQQAGGSVQVGFPVFGSRYTRLFTSYSLMQISYSGGSVSLRERYSCEQCGKSSLGFSLVRDTRIGLPFATSGTRSTVNLEFTGGLLGGDGDFQTVGYEGQWYVPLGGLGGSQQLGTGIKFVLGLTAKAGWIFGDAGPFFTDLYSMGGVQYGIPLRGYEEFSITPDGYDPFSSSSRASPNAFGQSYAAFTTEIGARMSQSLYVNAFFDAGNVYRTPSQFDPSRLYRGVGVGVALISPLGPIGVDLAYGIDRLNIQGEPAPGWKLHFKIGNIF